jgi:hypothetical protein
VPLTFEIAPAIDTQAKETFEKDARFVWAVYQGLWEENAIPESEVRLVLSDDFTADVRRLIRPAAGGEPSFSPERVGGLAAAKNLPQVPDYSEVAIVFDARHWVGQGDQPEQARVQQISLIAHELAHPPLERVLHVSGAIQEPSPTAGGTEMLRNAARVIVNEYRADRVADVVMRELATTDGGAKAGTWEAFGSRDCATLLEALTAAHPAWPDMVNAYRIRDLNLMRFLEKIFSAVGGTLVLLTHVQASADGAEQDLLGAADFEPLPAVRLYIAEPWDVFMNELRGHRMLPRPDETIVDDAALSRAGEELQREILSRLGLTIDDLDHGAYYVHVAEPLR